MRTSIVVSSLLLAIPLASGCKTGGPGVGGEDETDDGGDASTDGGSDASSGETDTGDTGGMVTCEDDPYPAVGTAPEAGIVSGVAVRNGHVYACARDGLSVWSFPDLDALAAPDGDECKRVAISADGTRLAVSGGSVRVYSLDDPAAPASAGTWSAGTRAEGLAFDGDRLAVADRESGVALLDVSAGLSTLSSFADADSDARDVAFDGARLVVADGYSGIRVLSQSGGTGGAWSIESTLDVGGIAYTVRGLGGDGWAVATLEGIALFDLADVSAPQAHFSWTSYGTAVDLGDSPATGPNKLLLADWNGMRGFDVTDLDAVGLDFVETLGAAMPGVRTVASDGGDVVVGGVGGLVAMQALEDCPGPAISTHVRRLDFGVVSDTATRVVQVRNEGAATLEVSAVDSASGTIEATPSSFSVDPGAVGAVEIAFTPADSNILDDVVRFTSNDVDDPVFELPFRGNDPGAEVGDPAPEITMVDLEGEVWTNADMLGSPTLLDYFATW